MGKFYRVTMHVNYRARTDRMIDAEDVDVARGLAMDALKDDFKMCGMVNVEDLDIYVIGTESYEKGESI